MNGNYPRDLIGYGSSPPHPRWPGDARIALSFVLNYEEGGERSVLDGDAGSENYLVPEIGQTDSRPGARSLSVEGLYEYGSRAGFWRILGLFDARKISFTSWAVGIALERNPGAAKAMAASGP